MKILLVEDEQLSRTYIAEFLQRLGHTLVQAGSGKEALAAFSEDFDLVLTDNRMPEMSGLDLLREIRLHPSGLDVDMILFTAYGDMQSVIEAMRCGASDYLLKPLELKELVRTLQKLERKRKARPVSPTIEAAQSVLKNTDGHSYPDNGLDNMGVFSQAMHHIMQLAERLHRDRSIPVLIEGETGTGKELIARYIHFGSGPSTRPFVALNCAALTSNIFESELFGYEGGAFSGAMPRGQRGKLDLANGGTLFLDEISEISPELQAKLLRVIQEKKYYRVGGLKVIQTDIRIICATNQKLGRLVEQGLFRADLYYRLNVGHLLLPPLRERKEDIIPLALMFLNNLVDKKNKKCKSINASALRILMEYNWPGNVRELKNLMEWVTLRYDDEELQPWHLELLTKSKGTSTLLEVAGIDGKNTDINFPRDSMPLADISNAIIIKALEMHRGNKTETAKYLGISRSSLYYRLKNM